MTKKKKTKIKPDPIHLISIFVLSDSTKKLISFSTWSNNNKKKVVLLVLIPNTWMEWYIYIYIKYNWINSIICWYI